MCDDEFNRGGGATLRWLTVEDVPVACSPVCASVASGVQQASESRVSTHATAPDGIVTSAARRREADRGAMGRVRRTAVGSAGHQTEAPRTLPIPLLVHLSRYPSYRTTTATDARFDTSTRSSPEALRNRVQGVAQTGLLRKRNKLSEPGASPVRDGSKAGRRPGTPPLGAGVARE